MLRDSRLYCSPTSRTPRPESCAGDCDGCSLKRGPINVTRYDRASAKCLRRRFVVCSSILLAHPSIFALHGLLFLELSQVARPSRALILKGVLGVVEPINRRCMTFHLYDELSESGDMSCASPTPSSRAPRGVN